MFAALLFACTPLDLDSAGQVADSSGADTSSHDSATDSGSGDSADTSDSINTGDLHGTVPTESLPAPEFAAINRDGSARSKPDLVGHPTVIWFYPLANSSG